MADIDTTGDRIAQLDRLRGVAILGIFFMNVPFMANSAEAYLAGRYDLMGWTGGDRIAFLLQALLAEGTARGLLEMLFGAGMVILTTRLAETMRWTQVFRAYYRRYILLFLFGVVHVYLLLWVGDILSVYGPAALLLFWFRNRSARFMLVAGLLLGPVFFAAVVGSERYFAPGGAVQIAAAEAAQDAGRPLNDDRRAAIAARDEANAERSAFPAKMATERAARFGDLATYAHWNHQAANEFAPYRLLLIVEALATMLIGAALFRWGLLHGSRGRHAMLAAMLIAYAVAFAIRLPIVIGQIDGSGSSLDVVAEAGRVTMTIGHVALVGLIAQTLAGARLLAPFAQAGRVALSLYLLQTVVGMWLVFPGIGLGYWGQLGWVGMMVFAVVFSLAQLLIAHLFLRRWRTGPVEWLWRRLSGAARGTRAPDGAGPPLPA